MKKDWTYKKLGELTKIKTGKLDANASSADGIYPFFTCSREPLRISSYSYDCECVLVAGNGELNVKYYNGKFDAYQRTYIIEALPDSGIMTYYMYHFFNQYVETLRQKSIGGIIKYIKLGDLTNALIPIPPLSIQRSIVAELDLLHSVISKKKEQLRELDNLAQSLFYQMFGDPITNPMGWEIKKLGEVAETTSGGTPSKSNNEYYENGTIPWLRSGEVSQGFIYNTELFITQKGLDNSSAKMIPVDSVAIAMYGATVGEVGIIKSPMCTNQAICSILPNKYLVPIYLRYFLMAMKPKYIAVAAGGAQPNISQAIIRNTHLPLPPLSLQQSFAAKVIAIEAQKQAITQSIQHAEALLAQRMDNYFG